MSEFASLTDAERDAWFADEARRNREQQSRKRAVRPLLMEMPPPEEPERFALNFNERLHTEEPAPASKTNNQSARASSGAAGAFLPGFSAKLPVAANR